MSRAGEVRVSLLRVFLLGMCIVPGACVMQGGETAAGVRRPVVPAAEMSDRAVAAEVVVEANKARVRQGLRALVVVEGMNEAARQHAEHLRARHELDHISWIYGRRDPAARLDAEGVAWAMVAENLTQLSARPGIPAAAIQSWLNSPGHRSNLLTGAFTITGVGAARDENGTYYIVQMYAAQ